MTQELWIMEENKRLDQQILDQQLENALRREALCRSVLKSKKNAHSYDG